MGKDSLIEAARLGNYPACEKILSSKPKKPGAFARYSEFNFSFITQNLLQFTFRNEKYEFLFLFCNDINSSILEVFLKLNWLLLIVITRIYVSLDISNCIKVSRVGVGT